MAANADEIMIAEVLGFVPKEGSNQAQLYTVDSTGKFVQVGSPMDIPFGMFACSGFFSDKGYVNLVFLYIDSGELQFYSVDADNSFELISESQPRVQPYSNVRAGRFSESSSYTDLMVFKDTHGQFYSTDGRGGLSAIGGGFDYTDISMNIKTGHFDLNTHITDMLFFDAYEGAIMFCTTDGKGNLVQIGQKQTIQARHWTDVVVGNFGGGTGCSDMMFVSEKGQAQFFKTPGDGTVVPIADPTNEGVVLQGLMISGVFAGGNIFDNILIVSSSSELQLYQTDGKGGLETVGPKQTWPESSEFYPISEVR